MLTFYFQGLGAENVTFCLKPILQRQWPSAKFILHDPISTDFDVDTLKDKQFIFITSAHPYYDEYYINKNYSSKFSFVNPIQLIQRYRPLLSVFIPHDLTEPIKFSEAPNLSYFDVVCGTDDRFKLFRRYIRNLLNIGWIKYASIYYQDNPELSSVSVDETTYDLDNVFFFSNFEMQRRIGFDASYKIFEPIFRYKVPIKLPEWTGVNLFESFLTAKGVNIIPNRIPSTILLQKARTVIVNANSSILTEAYFLNKRVINIIEDYQNEHSARFENKHMPDITHLRSSELGNFPFHENMGNKKDTNRLPFTIKPFDVNYFVETIKNEVDKRM